MSMGRLRTTKIGLIEDPYPDGLLPAEEKEMVIAQGKGKFAGETLVQIGHGVY